ncbi:MAG: hypothetical protein HeimC3_18560 [Candidatus Heimdallarchaeota archaeon LC_3]|nr:MAG: hypothetical protein HeimC3_18560 [Candidatus Heimdallarchaeota archaeon LC_3]
MYFLFLISLLGLLFILPLYFLSLEHIKLQEKYGIKKGEKFGEILGMISGWGFFLFLIGIWVSPQEKFIFPMLENEIIFIIDNFSVPLIHLMIFLILILPTLWISLIGVKDVSLKVAETHRTEKIITSGLYSRIRHPQYLGAFLAHVSITFLFSGLFSLLLSPVIIIYIYVISKKEEKELLKEFKEDYSSYMKKVPMFFPHLTK